MINSIVGFLFYMWAIFAIWYEIWVMHKKNWKTQRLLALKLTDDNARITGTESVFSLLHILYFTWVTIGLFSSQWILFLGIWIISLIGFLPFLKKKYWWSVIDSFMCILILFFVILNKYHFHINF